MRLLLGISKIPDLNAAKGNIAIHLDDPLGCGIGLAGYFNGSEGGIGAGHYPEPAGNQEDQRAKGAFRIDVTVVGDPIAAGQINGQTSEADGSFAFCQGVQFNQI